MFIISLFVELLQLRVLCLVYRLGDRNSYQLVFLLLSSFFLQEKLMDALVLLLALKFNNYILAFVILQAFFPWDFAYLICVFISGKFRSNTYVYNFSPIFRFLSQKPYLRISWIFSGLSSLFTSPLFVSYISHYWGKKKRGGRDKIRKEGKESWLHMTLWPL